MYSLETATRDSWSRWLEEEGTTVVLVDHEGEAANCRRQIAAQQGTAYIERIRVVPKAQWWVELWDSSFPAQQVLRPAQLLVLAERCLQGSPYLADTVIGVQGIAQRFVDAFELAERYALPPVDTHFASNEQQAFTDWRAQLKAVLKEQDALSAGQLIAVLQAHFASLELPGRVVVSAQLELSGPEQTLLQTMGEAGVQLYSLPPFTRTGASSAIRQTRCLTVREEVSAAVQWVAATLQDWDGSEPPKIALIAPELRLYEKPLQRALERYLYPASVFPHTVAGALSEPWRVGTGRLSGYPIVAAAMDALQVATGEAPLEQLSRLLRSSFMAGAETLAAERAQIDWRWRDRLQNRASLSSALREAQRCERQVPNIDETLAPLTALAEVAARHSGKALASAWVQRFDAELLAAGWPNREAGDPVVDQCRQGFSQVMDTLRALDRQLGNIDRREAMRWLQHVLQGKRFELRRDAAPLLQLISLEEARGQHFDALWILGLSDAALPVAVEPSPFLPREQLVHRGVPRADHRDALRRDRELLKAVMASAEQVVVSVPGQNKDGVPQAPCTLLEWQWPEWEGTPLEEAFSVHGETELPLSETVRPVSPAEKHRLRGGTGIFKAYATSPFAAFLKYRLGLQALPEPIEGLDPRTQGEWIHRALDEFWREVKSSERLTQMSNGQIEAKISEAIDRAMADAFAHGDELQRIEKRRIASLMGEWIAFEKERTEPFELVATEAGGEVDAFGIPLRIKVDRIDNIDGKRIIIDYKTGTVQANALNAENLLEPQLPLYALLGHGIAGGVVEGVALAQIHARDDMKVHMRSSWASNLVPKTVSNPVDTPEKWAAECEAWQKVLQRCAAGFLGGEAGHDYSLAASAFPYDPFVPALARAEVIEDE